MSNDYSAMSENKADRPHYVDHRKRLRERFRQSGEQGLHDYELLELLLTYAIPRQDVKPLAKRLIERFGSVSNVFDAPYEQLIDEDGLGPRSATLINLIRTLCTVYLDEGVQGREILASPDAVRRFAQAKLGGQAHEAFMAIFLNTKNEVVGHEIVQEGTVDRAAVYPRRVLESALSHNASGLILVHNHPSGHAEPSSSDRQLTQQLRDVTDLMDIRLLDHLIVSKSDCFSFSDAGFL